MESELVVGRAAVVFAVSKSLTETPTCYNFGQEGSTGSSSVVPYISGALRGAMWMQYGKVMGDNIIFTTGLVCMIMHCCYSFCFFLFADDKPTVGKVFGAVLALGLSAAAYVKFFVKKAAFAIYVAGVFACIANLLDHIAPIISLKNVIVSKSAETLTFRSVFASLVVNAIWLFYGSLIKNSFIKMPSLVGIGLSILQLMIMLFLFYKDPKLKPIGMPADKWSPKYSTFKTSE